jgi:hypothetical protein
MEHVLPHGYPSDTGANIAKIRSRQIRHDIGGRGIPGCQRTLNVVQLSFWKVRHQRSGTSSRQAVW